MSNPRQAALEALINILEKNIFADDALSSAFMHYKLNPKDKALATEIVYGTTRNMLTIDYLISKIASCTIENMSFNIRNIIRLAIYQLEYTRVPEYAAVNSAVELAKFIETRKAASFVNGVLRALIKKRPEIKFPNIAKNPVSALSIKYSHPQWLVERWLERFGLESTISLLIHNNTAPQTYITINTATSSLENVLNELSTKGIDYTLSNLAHNSLKIANSGSINNLPGYKEGKWYVQDEVSSFISDVLNPEETDLIVDLCAAPGTKTMRLANIMNNKGKIIAVDISENRLKKVAENCNRLNITNVECKLFDGTKFILPLNLQANKFLIDAPCSNTGVLAKRADARWQKNPKDLLKLTKTQYELICNAARLINPQGIIVYSVCSIEPEEGRDIIYRFLKQHPNFRLVDIRKFLPDRLKNSFNDYFLEFLPFKHLSDGFFIASVKKD